MSSVKAKVREIARWCGVALLGYVLVMMIIAVVTNINSFVPGVVIGGVCLLRILLLIAYRPRCR